MEKKIGFKTKVIKDDFKSIVEQFTKYWEMVINEIIDIVKARQV